MRKRENNRTVQWTTIVVFLMFPLILPAADTSSIPATPHIPAKASASTKSTLVKAPVAKSAEGGSTAGSLTTIKLADSPLAAKKKVSGAKFLARPTVRKTTASRRWTTRRPVAKAAPVSPAVRAQASEGVLQKVSSGREIPVENASALVPFFEQLYRHQKGSEPGPVRVLHYGDSHAAADELTGDMREQLQKVFGDGGPGYSYAGRPWNTYRREDLRSSSSHGWYSDGLMGRSGNGMYGLGGVSMSVAHVHESISLTANGEAFELYYLQQPGGGSIAITDNGTPVERISTAGDTSPGYYRYETPEGQHRIEVETLDSSPVRLFGWVAEKAAGITYETLGINGAEASVILGWNEEVLRSNLEHRKPDLIVLAYGTNEAGHTNLTQTTYRDEFVALIQRLRAAAPTATILVMGPPDRAVLTRAAGTRTASWVGMDGLDRIVEAQRQAALMTGCPFWDQRAKMGGKGAIREWVLAGMAQGDHVHLTATGYRLIANAMFRDLMDQYDAFLRTHPSLAASSATPAPPIVAAPR